MALTRNELVGKKIYNPDASLIGEVVDIGFSVGTPNPSLIVRIDSGVLIELPWEVIACAKDILLTSKVVPPESCKQITIPAETSSSSNWSSDAAPLQTVGSQNDPTAHTQREREVLPKMR